MDVGEVVDHLQKTVMFHVHGTVVTVETSGLPLPHTGEDRGSDWYPESCSSQRKAPFSPQRYHCCLRVGHTETPRGQQVNLLKNKQQKNLHDSLLTTEET